jgi:hypothetical protein
MAKRRQLEHEIGDLLGTSGKFTVSVGNEMLGSRRFVGVFDAPGDAEDYAAREIGRTRRFVTYELWTGTAQQPSSFVRALGRGTQ